MWRDKGKILNVVGFTLISFSAVVVVLRLYFRHFRMRAAGISDYIILVALISTWANTVLNYYQTKFGRESKISQVEKHLNSSRTQAAFAGTLLTWFIYRPVYIFTLSLVKLSILTFYRSLVPPYSSVSYLRSVRWAAYTLTIFMILYSVSMIAASIFQCTPVSAAYSIAASMSQLPNHQNIAKPHCYQPIMLWVFSAVVNFVTDFVVFVLPIPIVLSLKNMPHRKRVSLLGLFSIGVLAVVASAVLMWILVLWGRNVKSQSKYGTELLIWGQVEINCGILGANAMFLRPLFNWRRPTRVEKPPAMDMNGRKQERLDLDDPEKRIASEKSLEVKVSEVRSLDANLVRETISVG